jgi:hypothetical protein
MYGQHYQYRAQNFHKGRKVYYYFLLLNLPASFWYEVTLPIICLNLHGMFSYQFLTLRN